ncbi:protelomerase, partial [Xenorhabdus bovienii]|nr:protelomerase [Xenorhabdus bovienii]
DEMLDFARGDAGVRIHEATKQIVETYPNDLVTSSQLRALGFNIPLTKRYLEFTADALEQEIGENGRYQLVDNSPNIIIQGDEGEELEADIVDDESIDDDEIEIDGETTENEPEPEPEPETEKKLEQSEQSKPTERPRFSAPHRRDDGQWVVRFEYSGQNYSWVGQADNLKEAMIQAWAAYFD